MTQLAESSTLEELGKLCDQQETFAQHSLSLLASAGYTNRLVRKFLSSVLTNITTEGYPGERYHPGSSFADKVELLAKAEAKQAFRCSYANVQPHSASSANAAALIEFVNRGATIMGMGLRSGGHLTHGANTSFSGKLFESRPYELTNGLIDYDQIRDRALKYMPKMLICGASAYPRKICFATFKSIADEVGAILLADISHISGLVSAGQHSTPFGKAHIVTTSTYKQLSGPRGGLLLSDEQLVPNSAEQMKERLDHSVFPLIQGTPDIANIASKAAALAITQTDYFRNLMAEVVHLASTMAKHLIDAGFQLVTDGTDTHMILLDLRDRSMSGKEAEILLERIGILANRNLIPGDDQSPKNASGLRIGTNTLAVRKFGEPEVIEVVNILSEALIPIRYPSDFKQRKLRKRVLDLCTSYPIRDYS